MKIIIAGAGDVGFHLAKLLTNEKHAITLIDSNQEVLDQANSVLDVFTIRGESSSFSILRQAEVEDCHLFLAVTTSEENNLISSILAKKMGARQTIARVNNQEYLAEEQRALFKELGVDVLISPLYLAALEIQRLIEQSTYTDIFEFENGKISVLGLVIKDDSPLINRTLQEIDESNPNIQFRCIAILRGDMTIIPRGNTVIKRGDHIYLLAKKNQVSDVTEMIGQKEREVQNIMILGGKGLGFLTAGMLEDKYNITIVESSKNMCKRLAEKLHNTLIIKGDPSNVGLLQEEGLARMDVVISVTPNTETNIISCLMSERYGVYKTIALVDNADYIHISQNIGVDTLINKKLIAANNIFRFVRKGKIEAITSLHGVDAEVIEFVVQKSNRITKQPLRELYFPKQALIGGVIRGEESLIPTGDFQLQKDDKVIVFAKYEAIYQVEKFFR